MGNCLRHDHSFMTWTGDNWGSLTESNQPSDDDFTTGKPRMGGSKMMGAAEETLLGEKKGSSTQVKIKISKKELEELLGRVDIQEMSSEELCSQLLNVSHGDYHLQHHRWKPALESIPEVN